MFQHPADCQSLGTLFPSLWSKLALASNKTNKDRTITVHLDSPASVWCCAIGIVIQQGKHWTVSSCLYSKKLYHSCNGTFHLSIYWKHIQFLYIILYLILKDIFPFSPGSKRVVTASKHAPFTRCRTQELINNQILCERERERERERESNYMICCLFMIFNDIHLDALS